MAYAIRFEKPGGPDVLSWQQVEVGKPSQGQVRLRHKAVGLNYIDTYHRSGLYQLPGQVNISAFYNARQGYLFEANLNSPSRLNGAGIATILLDPVGDNRLPTYQNIDFHVERPVKVGTVRFIPSLDVFNVGNGNTILALQRQQNSAIANNISQVLAPRVARIGVRVNW